MFTKCSNWQTKRKPKEIKLKMDNKQMNSENNSNDELQHSFWRIAVVGGGAGALSFCVQLFKKLANSNLRVDKLEIVVLEKSSAIGPGLAYGKHLDGNLADANILNIPKDGMSLVLNEFGHFSGWLEQRGKEQKENDSIKMDDYKDHQFPPRHIFGEYLMEEAEKLAKESQKHPKIKINFLPNKIVDQILPIGENVGTEIFKVKYSSALGDDDCQQQTILANQVVLCVGHMPSHTYRHFIGTPGYGHDAKSTAEQFDRIEPMDPVIILGTRLSAIDLVLALQNKKHRGSIWICSRNGLLPAAYKPLNAVAVKMEGSDESLYKLVTKNWLESSQAKTIENHRTLALKYVHGSSIQNDVIYCVDSPSLPKSMSNENEYKNCHSLQQNALIGIKLGHEKLPAKKKAIQEGQWVGGDLNNNELEKSFGMDHFDEFAEGEKFTVKELLERFFNQLPEFGGPKMTLEEVIERNKGMNPLEWFEEQSKNSHPLAPVKPWQLFMTAIQPMVPALWSALDLEEKAKFWEAVHGLYMCYYPSCPHVNAKRMRDIFLDKHLRLLRHLGEVKFDEGMFVVEGEENEAMENGLNGKGRRIQIKAKYLFNATGPGMIAANIPVIEKLLKSGHAKQHPFGGIFVDEETMRVLSQDDDEENLKAHQNLFAIGDLTCGQFYKTACLGMVAEQADIVAEQIAHLFK